MRVYTIAELKSAENGFLPIPHEGETQNDANMRICKALFRIPFYCPPPGTPLGDWLDNPHEHIDEVIRAVTEEFENPRTISRGSN